MFYNKRLDRAACTVLQPLQMSGHLYYLASRSSAELLSRPLVKEVAKEVRLCLYRISHSHLPSTNHVNAELYGALRIVTTFVSCTVMRYGAEFGLCVPLGGSTIASYKAHNHIFGSSINWLLLPSNRPVLMPWGGQ
jgi:hypothetical protein